MTKVTAAIAGPGNIGTDLLAKLRRSDHADVRYMVGVDPESDGLRPAQGRSTVPCAPCGPARATRPPRCWAHEILQRAGEAGYVGGQEGMIIDVALRLAREHELAGSGAAQ